MPTSSQLRLAAARAEGGRIITPLVQSSTISSSLLHVRPSTSAHRRVYSNSNSNSSSKPILSPITPYSQIPQSTLYYNTRQPTANMSSMSATHGHNEACCNIPPVVSKGYDAKGAYEEIDGLKTYVTGPADATKGIVVIYDIFGYFEQTLQGADILATSHHEKYKVFIPDWFKGEPCPIEWYPPTTDEQKKNLGAFFGKNPPPGVAAKLPEFVKALGEKNPSIKSWGIIGFCWGGKVVSLVTSGDSNPFTVAAECHPAMVEPSEAESIKIPLILLASKEEPDDKVKEFEAKLNVPKHVETFKDQIHGWMAARSDLSDVRVKEEYTRGYKTVLDFFSKNWS